MPNRWIETLKDGYKYPTPSPSSDQQGMIESALTALGFGVIVYSLYVD